MVDFKYDQNERLNSGSKRNQIKLAGLNIEDQIIEEQPEGTDSSLRTESASNGSNGRADNSR